MPKYWYTFQKNPYNDEKTEFENRIAATLKPYFMIYIYPQLKSEYDEYISGVNDCCHENFRMGYKDLLQKENKNKEEQEFVENVNKYLPVSDKQSVMNRLCHIVESAFDGYVSSLKSKKDFKPDILKSDVSYSKTNYNAVAKLYAQYTKDVQSYLVKGKYENIKQEDRTIYYQCLFIEYKRLCVETCPDEAELCNILIDLCYNKEKSKQFVWAMCGETIIQNLLQKYDNTISYLERDENGDIDYCGYKFSKKTKKIGELDGAVFE